MELNEFRFVMENLKVDLWNLIDTAIHVASVDHAQELKNRRDAIVERLYAPPLVLKCQNCDHQDHQKPATCSRNDIEKHQLQQDVKKSYYGVEGSQQLMDMNGDQEDDEQRKILVIKKHLEDPDQTQERLVDLLQNLLKMDITFNALKETDIGRHVNRFRKHTSNEVRKLVKLLVRKWKETVDEWVRLNTPLEAGGSPSNGDGDSPHDHTHQKNNIQSAFKEKVPPNGDVLRPPPPPYLTPKREMKDNLIDLEKLTSARKRLHENFQEAENAKKQRTTTQVMNFHDVPKTRNPFVAKNRSGVQVKHW